MANALRYTFQVIGDDSSAITFDNIDAAKDLVDLGGWTLPDSGVVYTLEDSDTTLVVTIDFGTGLEAMDAFHNNVKDGTWSTGVNSPYFDFTAGGKIFKDENGTEKEK
jgi:hypothetical protein|tara:strand:+ start:793 stop:1116 length:324 start_codon:yes stop_codon:yes gene_type:complete